MIPSSPCTYLQAIMGGRCLRFPVLRGSVCRIGRNSDSEIPLPEGSASRNHALVQHTGSGDLYLTDLGSRNGTFVNGCRVTGSTGLRRGDVISIGDQEFVLQQDGASRPSTTTCREASATLVTFKMQLLTVFVADIRNYTCLSRRVGESRISQIIGVFMQEAGAMLQRHGSWAQKYIGDAVMSIWVHHNQRVEGPELVPVLRALVELSGIVDSLQSRFRLDAPVRIGVGVNTGLAATGNMGSNACADHTALGDVVNKAFRLESATKEIGCEVALGRTTYEALASSGCAGDIPELHSVKLKGYEEPEPVFTLDRSSLTDLCRVVEKEAGNHQQVDECARLTEQVRGGPRLWSEQWCERGESNSYALASARS